MRKILWWEYLNGKGHLEELSLGGKMILKWHVKDKDGRAWTA
jgi:hypothetical protein